VRERPLDDLVEREEARLLLDDETRLLDEALLVRASALTSDTHIEDATISAASTNVSGLNLVKTRFFRSIKIKIRGYQERIINSAYCLRNTTQVVLTPRQPEGSQFRQT